jgi:endogenous inhibitor of DNA gyrase (YacG/DUF329 family)
MTGVELVRIARSIIPPVGATMAIARVDEQLKHRAAFLIDGRIHGDAVGPAFDRPRDAIALVRILNGDEASRPAPDPDLARPALGTGSDRRDADPTPPEAPVLGAGASTLGPAVAIPPAAAGASRTAGTCPGCGGPLPPGRRGQARATCSDRCRRRVARRAAEETARLDTDGAGSPVTPSRPSTDPTARPAADAHRLPAAGRDARPEPGSAGPLGDNPTLGLL